MLNRTRTLGAIAGLFSGALLLSACGQPAPTPAPAQGGSVPTQSGGIAPGEDAQTANGSSQNSGNGSSQAGDSSKPGGNGSRPTAGGTVHTGKPDKPTTAVECTASDYKVDLNVQPDRPGILLMAVTNQSQKDCHLSGWPTVAPVNMAGEEGDVPVQKVEIPGGPTDVTIKPGNTAFAGVKLVLGDKGSSNAVTATGFNVRMPGIDTPINGNIIGTDGSNGGYAEFTVESIQVGTLQPAAQGVTVFD